jgi:hypothetical protein
VFIQLNFGLTLASDGGWKTIFKKFIDVVQIIIGESLELFGTADGESNAAVKQEVDSLHLQIQTLTNEVRYHLLYRFSVLTDTSARLTSGTS